jgi:hypothetical protein
MNIKTLQRMRRITGSPIPKEPSVELLEEVYYTHKLNDDNYINQMWKYAQDGFKDSTHPLVEDNFFLRPYEFPYSIEDGIHCILYCKVYTKKPKNVVKRLLGHTSFVVWKGDDTKIWSGTYYHVVVQLDKTKFYEDRNRPR